MYVAPDEIIGCQPSGWVVPSSKEGFGAVLADNTGSLPSEIKGNNETAIFRGMLLGVVIFMINGNNLRNTGVTITSATKGNINL